VHERLSSSALPARILRHLGGAIARLKDNVHWLVATSKVAATFDVIVPGLDPARPTEFMDYVDPRRAEPTGDGALRAPRLDADEVFRRYGSSGV